MLSIRQMQEYFFYKVSNGSFYEFLYLRGGGGRVDMFFDMFLGILSTADSINTVSFKFTATKCKSTASEV